MSYTILSAKYANAENTAAVLQTVEAGAVLVSQRDTPALWAQMFRDAQPAAYVHDIKGMVEGAVQHRLDNFARAHGYDSLLSVCSYAASKKPKWRAEAEACIDARDAHWTKCLEILEAVTTGARPVPTLNEVLAEMPTLVWPT